MNEEQILAMQQENANLQNAVQQLQAQVLAMQQQQPQQQAMAFDQAPVPAVVPIQVVENVDDEGKKITRFIKIKPDKFSGSRSKDPEEWAYEVANTLEAAGITLEETKILAVKHALTGQAAIWWRSITEGHVANIPTTFEAFKHALIQRYRPKDPAYEARQKLDSLKQTGSAEAYADKFLTMTVRTELTEEEMAYLFMKGLKPRIKAKVLEKYKLKELHGLEALMTYAIAVDDATYEAGNDKNNGAEKIDSGGSAGNGKSWKGQHAGHASTSSKHPASTTTPMEIDSFKKIEKLTPETRAQNVVESGDSLPVVENLEQEIDEVVDVDLIKEVARWKSAKLLRTKFRVGCVEADTLFDSGSSVNLVADSFVLKHKLKTRTIENGPTFRTADGRYHRCEKVLDLARIRASCYSDTLTNIFVLLGDCPFDLVLGKPWFDEKNPQIDWPNNLITLQHDGKTIAFRADYHDQKHLKKNGLISAVEMEAELSSGNIVHFCVIKPIPEKYENYEYGSDGKNLEKNGLEKHVDMLVDEFVDVFDPDLPLPVDREIEHEIELEPGASPVAQQMYRLSFEELAELKTQILDYLNRGFIRPSKSPYGAPILFVRKKSGALRMCVDYRGLNRITKKNRCPLPRIDDLLDKLAGAKYFTSLDLKSAYHQIKIKEEDIEKTAFRTPFGHFEFVVLPFGLCNAPATFQTLMNNVFRDELHQFVLCYLDDIMIFSKSLQAHIQHVRHVFEKLRKNKLFVNKEKCLFFQTKIAWLGYIISENGIKVDQSKISTILEWPVPKNTIDILSFLGFTGYYRKFIEKYSHIAAPMTELLKKDISFIWTPTQQQAFETLKSKLTTAPILILPSPDFPFEMYTDASDFAFGGVLMQDQGQGLKPVAFSSKKLSEAERKYDIYEKEALSQIHHLKLWRCYIQSAHRSTAYTDNNVLKYLQTQPRLSPRQARWMEVLSQFNVYVEYITGKANVVADALSRRPDFAMTVVFACQDSDWLLQLKESYKESPEAKKIIQLIQEKQSRDYVFDHGYIVRRTPENTQLYVPEGPLRKELVEEHHDSLLAGHFGVAKTAALLLRCYYWPQLQRDVRRGVQSCERCGASKSSNQKKAGLLQPLPTPTRRFEVITMDFVTSLPDVDNFNAIMIMVDKLTKRVFLAPTTDKVTAEEAATLFYRHVVRNQGVPSTIISDRGTQFTSIFWKSMIAQLGIKHKLSTAYHPQTDGQSEITVRIVVDMLRTLHQEYPNWVQILPAVEFAINNSKNVSTGKTPFFLCYGEEVPTPPTLNLQALAKLNPNQPSVDFAARTQIAIQEAQRMLAEAQRKQKYYADQGRRHLTFEEGDQVYISTADLPLKGPRKLAPKWFGPIPVVKKLSPLNYQVALPPIWRRRYPIFHVEKLKPFVQSTEFPNRYPARPPPDLEQGPDVFNVEKILDRRSTPWGRGFKVEYYVKWEGYPLCDSTWEPKSNFRDAGTEVKRMLREIDQQHDAT
ncbi:hypothetical protein KSW81_001142 [Nannochloris sp. 'desiccata']|nr:hypothetical protein KSW81_001142 [Chlorella desiccata (nom. nud.)]